MLVLFSIERRIQQDVTKTNHGIHWRADLMTHVGQECSSGRGSLFRSIFSDQQVIFHLPAIGNIHDKTIQPEDFVVIIANKPAMLTQPADLTSFVENTVLHAVFGLANQRLLDSVQIIRMK